MMRCRECGAQLERLDNRHLLACSGLTLHEYAIRHHMPLDLLVHPDQVNVAENPDDYPYPACLPSDRAQATLQGLRMAGRVREDGDFTVVDGDVRRIEQLLWNLKWLRGFGFRFRQDFRYSSASHRVVARNRLMVPTSHLRGLLGPAGCPVPPPGTLYVLAICAAQVAEMHGGYLFLPVQDGGCADALLTDLKHHYGVRMTVLEEPVTGGDRLLLRTATRSDAERLVELLGPFLSAMPQAMERFADSGPAATVVKELVFDSAHFITDHPAKCSNLHGGRYVLQVAVRDRIDPVTGCVIDYGYLKQVVNRRVIERFDHHTLNFEAPELAWRSSTEMLCVYIWEQLIDYLPGLAELRLYETTQSWCCYRGPDLDQMQRERLGRAPDHFQRKELGRSPLRRLAAHDVPAPLRVASRD